MAVGHAQRGISLAREFHTRLVADVVTGKLDVRSLAAELTSQSVGLAPDAERVSEEESVEDAPLDEAEDAVA